MCRGCSASDSFPIRWRIAPRLVPSRRAASEMLPSQCSTAWAMSSRSIAASAQEDVGAVFRHS